MNKDILNSIKDVVNKIQAKLKFENEENAPKAYAESELQISEKAVGGKVELINADGSLSPIEDGEYALEGGDKFKVEGGFIVEWNGEKAEDKPSEEAPAEDKPAEMAEDAPAQEDAPADEPAEEPTKEDEPAEDENAALKAELDAMKAETESLKVAVQEIQQMLQAMQMSKDEFSTQLTAIKDSLALIAKMPVEFSKTTKSNTVKDDYAEKAKEMQKIYASNSK